MLLIAFFAVSLIYWLFNPVIAFPEKSNFSLSIFTEHFPFSSFSRIRIIHEDEIPNIDISRGVWLKLNKYPRGTSNLTVSTYTLEVRTPSIWFLTIKKWQNTLFRTFNVYTEYQGCHWAANFPYTNSTVPAGNGLILNTQHLGNSWALTR